MASNIHRALQWGALKDFGGKVVLAFADPCAAATHPGWALRNLAVMAAVRWGPGALEVLCVRRPGGRVTAAACLRLTLHLTPPPAELLAPGRAV